MDLETLATFGVPVLFLAFIAFERLRPARPLTKVSWWKLKGVAFFVIMVVVSSVAPMLWMDFVSAHRLMDLEWTGIWGGAAIAFVGTQFFAYWWHRLLHNTSFLWRWFHQMHHSAERLDVFGGVYFSPLDVVGFSFVQSVVPYMVLGVSGEAAVLTGLAGMFYSLFQHTNVKTPRWLGYAIQRPESHSVHHGRGIHAYNYGDFPIWDILFGTFKNPEHFEAETGFWDGASKRVADMLIGRDVTTPPAEEYLKPAPQSVPRPPRAAAA
jgi:sterol desaturase/sphingolipid hydroxylase (fatty acid hydroxylase superfamily)